MAHVQTDDPAFHVFCQLVAAFGQGAGTVNVTAEAMSFVVTQYWPRLSQEKDVESALLQALEFARGLGRLSAQRALAAGWNAIRSEDVKWSDDALKRHPQPFGRCPFC